MKVIFGDTSLARNENGSPERKKIQLWTRFDFSVTQ